MVCWVVFIISFPKPCPAASPELMAWTSSLRSSKTMSCSSPGPRGWVTLSHFLSSSIKPCHKANLTQGFEWYKGYKVGYKGLSDLKPFPKHPCPVECRTPNARVCLAWSPSLNLLILYNHIPYSIFFITLVQGVWVVWSPPLSTYTKQMLSKHFSKQCPVETLIQGFECPRDFPL